MSQMSSTPAHESMAPNSKRYKSGKTNPNPLSIDVNVEDRGLCQRYTFPCVPLMDPPREAWLDAYREPFLCSSATELFELIPWPSRRNFMGMPVPRLEVAMWNPLLEIPEGDWHYTYSRRPYTVATSVGLVNALLQTCFGIVKTLETEHWMKYKFALLVGYVGERDSVNPHQDLGHGQHPIYSFSLYDESVSETARKFVISPHGSTFKLLTIPMGHGTMVVMGGKDFQDPVRGLDHWVPKEKVMCGKRINVTIRAIDECDDQASLKQVR